MFDQVRLDQVRLGQQSLQLAVLQLQFAQPFGLRGVHALVLEAPLVKGHITEADFATDLLDLHAGLLTTLRVIHWRHQLTSQTKHLLT